MNWQLSNIPGLCTDGQAQKFTCIDTFSFYTSSLIWGTLGPARMYGMNALYNKALYAFLLGAIVPIPLYILSRWRFPKLRHVYTPLLLIGGRGWAPMNLTWCIPPLYIGYIFQVHIRRKHFAWWSSYNVIPSWFMADWQYLTSNALTCGSAFAVIVLFFGLQYHGIELQWWGTSK
jgi:hypothetical protein